MQTLESFSGVSRVKVADKEHPLCGKSGVIVRRKMGDDGAWVKMLSPIPSNLQSFSDDRKNNVELYPDQCEDADNIQVVPIAEFGKDHWSLLGYIETLCVDHSGKPANDRLRCNHLRHEPLLGRHQRGMVKASDPYKYGSRLKGHTDKKPVTVDGHDDYDCADDLVAAGLIKVHKLPQIWTFKMTNFGNKVAAMLREHKTAGGQFADFQLK